MPLRYVLDEQLRRALWRATQQYNAAGVAPIDVVRVGGPADPPLGTVDPDLLLWAESQNRILVSFDKKTMPQHLADHLQSGRHSPGVFIIRPGSTIPQVVSFLVIAAYACDPDHFRDRVEYIP
jgi:hypothetical protein